MVTDLQKHQSNSAEDSHGENALVYYTSGRFGWHKINRINEKVLTPTLHQSEDKKKYQIRKLVLSFSWTLKEPMLVRQNLCGIQPKMNFRHLLV